MAEGQTPKIDYAKKVAAALGYVGLKNLDRVGGASFSSLLHKPLTLGRGRKQILNLFSFLANLSCAGMTNIAAAIHSFTRLFPHPGLVVVVSDLFDPAGWRSGIEELAKKKYQLLVIHIVDEREINPACFGDVALNDVESGRERRFFLDDQLIRRFQEELNSYFGEIEAVCAGRHIVTFTNTQVPLMNLFSTPATSQQRHVSHAGAFIRAFCRQSHSAPSFFLQPNKEFRVRPCLLGRVLKGRWQCGGWLFEENCLSCRFWQRVYLSALWQTVALHFGAAGVWWWLWISVRA